MAVDVQTEIEIDRPRGVVAAYASDPDNATAWYQNIKSVEWKSSKPLAVGSRVTFVAHFLGRTLSYTYEVRELVPDERFTQSTAEGPFPMETTYTWDDTSAGGTKMKLRNRGDPTGFSKLTAPLMAGAMRRANKKDLARLKAILETETENLKASSHAGMSSFAGEVGRKCHSASGHQGEIPKELTSATWIDSTHAEGENTRTPVRGVKAESAAPVNVELSIAAFLVGAVVSLATSWVLVSRLERVGERLGLSEALLGMVAALAADAPEITASITALVHHQATVGAGVVLARMSLTWPPCSGWVRWSPAESSCTEKSWS